jgi:hypothetical protein
MNQRFKHMKYGILVIAIVMSGQVFGQQARISAQSFLELSQSMAPAQEIAATSTNVASVTISQNTNSTQGVYEIETPTVSSGVVESTCDVVVQEELVAGRITIGDGFMDTKINFGVEKIKSWFSGLFSKK